MSRPTLSQSVETFRRKHTAPLAAKLGAFAKSRTDAARALLQAKLAPALKPLTDPLKRGAAALRTKLAHDPSIKAIAAALAFAEKTRLETIEKADAFAIRSRAACRRAARRGLEALRDPIGSARAAYAALKVGLPAFGARLRRLNTIDATVAGLFALAVLAPLSAPYYSDSATIALTRHNPFVERVGATAERGVALPAPNTPTHWTGVKTAQAERAAAPDWVVASGVDLGPLTPAEALTREARVVELEPAPLWSPALDALSVEDEFSEFASLETASIPGGARRPIGPAGPVGPMNDREIAALELGAFDTGPTAPVGLADAGDGLVGPDGLAAGDYATASVGVSGPVSAWPAAETVGGKLALPSSIAAALNLPGAGAQTVPPSAAPIPSLRPTRAGPQRTARVTVVLTAIGLNETASRSALDRLPSAVAFAVAPVAKDPKAWVEAAQASGRVALLEIPMEPVSYPRINPGPLTLLTASSAEENVKRLEEALAAAPEVDGVASYLGGRFASSRGAVEPVLTALKQRELFMLETNPGPLSHLRRSAAEIGLPAASSVVSLDKAGRSSDLSEGFARLEEAAKAKGHAIGVAVAVPASIDALTAWIRDLEKRGFRLTALAL